LEQQLRLREHRIDVLEQQIAQMATSMERLATMVERIPSTTAGEVPSPATMVIREPQPRLRLAPAQPGVLPQPSPGQARWTVEPAGYTQ
jgi:hypothetical protein